MRRIFLLPFAAALALAACTGAGSPEAEGTGDAAATGASASATTSADMTGTEPDTPVSSTPASEATATPVATRTARDVDSNPPGDECGASQVAAFVAQKATPAVRARLAAKVGHSRIRWVGPDTVVTMDYSPARLNVALDKANVITGGKCG